MIHQTPNNELKAPSLGAEHRPICKPKIYISGPISERNFDEAFVDFEKADAILKTIGFDVVNPMKLDHTHDQSWQAFMKNDIKHLCDCDAIFLLKEWYDSKGAALEQHIASRLGMKQFSWSAKPSELSEFIKSFI